MHLYTAEKHMRTLMLDHGLVGWTFAWDRAVQRRGQCNHRDRRITMSRRLTEIASDDEAEQTMLHEIAHALVGHEHGHDSVWLRQARAIGFRGSRTSTRENEVPTTFVAVCPGCKREVGRHRRPKGTVSCGRCSGRVYQEKFRLVFTRRSA